MAHMIWLNILGYVSHWSKEVRIMPHQIWWSERQPGLFSVPRFILFYFSRFFFLFSLDGRLWLLLNLWVGYHWIFALKFTLSLLFFPNGLDRPNLLGNKDGYAVAKYFEMLRNTEMFFWKNINMKTFWKCIYNIQNIYIC